MSERHVIEDAIHLDSRSSQIIQMADLVAWSAFTSLERYSQQEFAWDWYGSYLSERDPFRVPREL